MNAVPTPGRRQSSSRKKPRTATQDKGPLGNAGPFTEASLAGMSTDELRAACKACRLKGYGQASHDTLRRMLVEWRPAQSVHPPDASGIPGDPVAFLQLVGPLAFGEDWQTPIAHRLGVTPRHLRFVLAGTRKLSPDVSRRVREAVQGRLEEIEAQAARLRRILAGENETTGG